MCFGKHGGGFFKFGRDFDHLSRAMTMHDKANFTIFAPIYIYIYIIENKLFKLKI